METSPDTRWVEIHHHQEDHGHQVVDPLQVTTPNSPATLLRVAIHPGDTHHNQVSSRVLHRAKAPLDEVLQDTRSKEHPNNQEQDTPHKDTSLGKIHHTLNQVRIHNSNNRDGLQCRASGVVLVSKDTLPSKDIPRKALETRASSSSKEDLQEDLVNKSNKESPTHGRILA